MAYYPIPNIIPLYKALKTNNKEKHNQKDEGIRNSKTKHCGKKTNPIESGEANSDDAC